MFKIIKECYQDLIYCVFLLYITCFRQKLFTHNVFSPFFNKTIVWLEIDDGYYLSIIAQVNNFTSLI